MLASRWSTLAMIGHRLGTGILICVAFAAGCQEKPGATPVSPTTPTPPRNRQPQVVGSIQAQQLEEGAQKTVPLANNFNDPDGDPLTYSATSQRTSVVSVVQTTGSVVTIRGEAVGTATIVAQATDTAGLTATQSFNVTVTERPVGVCERTAQIRDAILAVLGSTSCASITRSQLAGIDSLNVSEAGLTGLRADDFALLSGLTTLRLGGNRLSELPRNVFSDLSNLESLNLPNNRLRELPPELISGLSNLRHLELHNNLLTQLSDNTFSRHFRLQSLGLDANQFSRLPRNVFAGLDELESLDLTDNDLRELPAGIFADLSSLQQLRLGTNKLSTLPDAAFSGLSSIKSLVLSNNILQELPAGVFSGLSTLEELRLDTNQLSSLPRGVFVGLSELRRLSLEGNRARPFRATLRLERTDATPASASSPATVRVVLPEGAPFAITVELLIVNASISRPSATVARGDSISQVVTVRKGPLNRPSRVTGSILTGIPDAITGIIFDLPDELVLFGTETVADDGHSRQTVIPAIGTPSQHLGFGHMSSRDRDKGVWK